MRGSYRGEGRPCSILGAVQCGLQHWEHEEDAWLRGHHGPHGVGDVGHRGGDHGERVGHRERERGVHLGRRGGGCVRHVEDQGVREKAPRSQSCRGLLLLDQEGWVDYTGVHTTT